jgi:hypothetical protein
MATKYVYLQDFGMIEVPAELEGDALIAYANREADKMLPPPLTAGPEEKPAIPLYKQIGAGLAAAPQGLVSGAIGTPLEGIGGLIGVRALEDAGAGINKWADETTRGFIGDELADSTGATVGRTIGGIASFFTPGVAAKVAGFGGKVAKGLALGASALQGAGEQVDRMRTQEEAGADISQLERSLYSGLAGAGTAALEGGLGRLVKYTPLERILGRFPVKSVEAENLAKAYNPSSSIIKEALKSGAGEAVTETGQEALQNVIEKYGYNPDRAITENLKEAALVGGLAGGVLQGGVDLYARQKIRKGFNEARAEAERQRLEPVQIPDVDETTAFITPQGVTTVEGRIEREAREFQKKKEEEEAAGIDEIQKRITEPAPSGIGLLPAADGAYAPEDYAKIEELRLQQEESNAAARKEYEAQVAKRAEEDIAFVQSDPAMANDTAKLLGYKSRLQVKKADYPALADAMRWRSQQIAQGEGETAELQRMYVEEQQQKKIADDAAIEQDFGLASDLSRREFGKPLGQMSTQERSSLAELLAVEKATIAERESIASDIARDQTAANEYSSMTGDPLDKRLRRASSKLYNTPNWERLPQEQRRIVEQQANEQAGTEVLPEQVTEELEFEDKPYTTDGFRAVLSKLKQLPRKPNGLIPVNKIGTTAAINTARKDPRLPAGSLPTENTFDAAKAMLQHMEQRGNIVDIDGKKYLAEDENIPKYDISKDATESTPPTEAEKRQFVFDKEFIQKEIEPKIAPQIRDAIKRRNVEDLFLVGLSGKIGDGKKNGVYLDRVIRVAVAPDGNVRSLEDMQGTVDHEIIHGMKELGLFSKGEWAMLTSKFNANTMDEERRKMYESRYAGRPKLAELISEEAVADAARKISTADPKRLIPSDLTLRDKVGFYLNFGRKAASLGYDSADDILSAIKTGEIGKRRFTPAFEKTAKGVVPVAQREIDIKQPKAVAAPAAPVAASTPAAPAAPVATPAATTPAAAQAATPDPTTEVGPEAISALPPSIVAQDSEAGSAELSSEAPAQAAEKPADLMSRGDSEGGSKYFAQSGNKTLIDKVTDAFRSGSGVFRYKLVDKHDPARKNAIAAYQSLMRKYEESGDQKYLDEANSRVSAANGAYAAMLFADKAQDTAMAFLQFGGGRVKNGIIQAEDSEWKAPLELFRELKEKGKLEQFMDAAYAERYMDLRKQGKDPGGLFPEAEVAADKAKFDKDQDIQNALSAFKSYTDNLSDLMVQSGMISRKQAYAWKQAYYIPFYRIPTMTDPGTGADTGEVDWPSLTSQVTNISGIKELTGRKLGVNDAIENIVANTTYIVGNAAKNIAAQRVARDGMDSGYMKEVSKPSASPDKNKVVTVRDKGEKRYFYVEDQLLYDSVAQSGMPVQDVLRAMGWFTQALRKGVTISPTFIVRNAIRDTVQVWLQGGYGKDFVPPVGELVDGISMVANNAPEYQALKKAGIAGSGLRERTIKDTAAAIRREIGEGQTNVLMKVYDYMSSLADKSESITRSKVYKDVLAKTGDEAEALFAAMETINFSRKGASRGLQIGMALVPFFNARIQGMDVFYRTLKGESMMPNQMTADAKKRAMTRMMYAAALSTLYALSMADHPAWENATEEEKDSNLFLPIPFAEELGIRDGTALKFPIPQEIGIITKMLPERMVSYLMGKTDINDNIDAIQRTVFDTLSFNPVPQAFLPAIEVSMNFDTYTQRAVENDYIRRLLPEERYNEYTTGVAKAVGKLAGYSPTKIDHLIRGYFGTMGAYVADVAGQLIESSQEIPKPERLRFSEPYLAPVLGPLFKSPDGRKFAEELYKIDSAADMAVATLESYSKGRRDMPAERKDELRELAMVSNKVRPILARVQALNGMKRSIQVDRNMSPSEKRDRLNEIQKDIIETAKRAQEYKSQIPLRLR